MLETLPSDWADWVKVGGRRLINPPPLSLKTAVTAVTILLVKVASGNPFRVGERSGKTPRRGVPPGAGGSADLQLWCVFGGTKPQQFYPTWKILIHLLPIGSSQGFLHPIMGFCNWQKVLSYRKLFWRHFLIWVFFTCLFKLPLTRVFVYLQPRRIRGAKQWGLSVKSLLCTLQPAAFKLHHYIQKGPHPFKAATIDLIIVRWRRRGRGGWGGVEVDEEEEVGGKSGWSPRITVSVRRLSEKNTDSPLSSSESPSSGGEIEPLVVLQEVGEEIILIIRGRKRPVNYSLFHYCCRSWPVLLSMQDENVTLYLAYILSRWPRG